MRPSKEQIEALARLAIDTRPEEIDCDELLRLVGRYAELVVAGEPVPAELLPVAVHLRLCPECAEEFLALRAALEGG